VVRVGTKFQLGVSMETVKAKNTIFVPNGVETSKRALLSSYP